MSERIVIVAIHIHRFAIVGSLIRSSSYSPAFPRLGCANELLPRASTDSKVWHTVQHSLVQSRAPSPFRLFVIRTARFIPYYITAQLPGTHPDPAKHPLLQLSRAGPPPHPEVTFAHPTPHMYTEPSVDQSHSKQEECPFPSPSLASLATPAREMLPHGKSPPPCPRSPKRHPSPRVSKFPSPHTSQVGY
ncbi:hypothetical protein BD310DRAFT_305579 [Dichomitus squalens]|uniref:Uncharacterized protein n=1 Tax=Dichomitus squalens TaxID=114155 RepID=A0A4Q9QD06_9APHY|nr:hypothetical protein BD310DRAFT_305579 [Dichomitus squalens]